MWLLIPHLNKPVSFQVASLTHQMYTNGITHHMYMNGITHHMYTNGITHHMYMNGITHHMSLGEGFTYLQLKILTMKF
jgi:hypothetical protein